MPPAGARYFIIMGGRSRGGSYVASQYALAKLNAPDYFRCAVMRFVLDDVRDSIFQEIIDRADEQGIKENLTIREHLLTIGYGANKIIGKGFKKSSGEQKSKLKSLANFNSIIIEEADEVSEDDFMQLDDTIRTTKSDIMIILVLNSPHKNHWIIKRWFNLVPSGVEGYYRAELKSTCADTVYMFSTLEDNIANVSKTTIANFENYKKTRPDHYWNMIKGLVSEGARGRIFKTWKPIPDKDYEELPYAPFNGLDFGFTNDPTALIEIKEHNDKVYLRELIYETGLTNPLISRKMTDLGVKKETEIYGDSAEPKSIEEIRTDGWNVLPSTKGADSVNAGIDMLMGKEVYYTESSVNIAREVQDYVWALDRNKEPTNNPVDKNNHAMDAVRGAIFTRARKEFVGFV
jgi:phage terminase large subunit